jgi:hypothetical protein
MKNSLKIHSDDALPLLWTVGVMLGVVLFVLSFGFLFEPTVYENPGLAAYSAPPETRLVPLLRESDAPALVDLSETAEAPSTALARAQPMEQAKPAVRSTFRKRPQVTRRQGDPPRGGYSAQGKHAYRDWDSNRAWGGGLKGWF